MRKAKRPDLVVSEERGVRHLHVGGEAIQSAMRLDDPFALELDYTRCMMAFLLFHPQPRHVAMLGLGGGSLAKFVHHRVPDASVTVVENNPHVIAAARSLFSLPPASERFAVIKGDGAEWVRDHPDGCDVLMVDAYDGDAQVGELATEGFYAEAASALQDDGVLVVNLWSSDRSFDLYVRRIERAFDGRVLCLPAERRGNVAIFGFRCAPGPVRWPALRQRAAQLEKAVGLEFPDYVERLREMNPHDDKRLII